MNIFIWFGIIVLASWIILLYLLPFLIKFFLKRSLRKSENHYQNEKKHNREHGSVHIDFIPDKKNKDIQGEYINFEEINEK